MPVVVMMNDVRIHTGFSGAMEFANTTVIETRLFLRNNYNYRIKKGNEKGKNSDLGSTR
jgi:hypothetical protein